MERNLEKLNVSSLDLLHYMPGSTLSGHLDNAVSSVCTEWLRREFVLLGIVEIVDFSLNNSKTPWKINLKNIWKFAPKPGQFLVKSWNFISSDFPGFVCDTDVENAVLKYKVLLEKRKRYLCVSKVNWYECIEEGISER